ncbi:sorting nexin-10A-like, partial [Tachysurus ichikawai]
EFVSVWVRDPQFHKEDFWHTHIDYEICLHTNSICFQKKTSCVRRRYSEFVWLHQRLKDNALLVQLQKLPPANPFFSLSNPLWVAQCIEGLQKFLEAYVCQQLLCLISHLFSFLLVLKIPLLLSDSHLHLFLQSQLSIAKIEACVQGQTSYTVAEAIHCYVYDTRFPLEDERKSLCNLDCESIGSAAPIEMSSKNRSPGNQLMAIALDPEPTRCLSSSPESQQDTHT